MDNQPILSYEKGDLVLYGYLFDKVIDTKTGKMYNLINTPTKSFKTTSSFFKGSLFLLMYSRFLV